MFCKISKYGLSLPTMTTDNKMKYYTSVEIKTIRKVLSSERKSERERKFYFKQFSFMRFDLRVSYEY